MRARSTKRKLFSFLTSHLKPRSFRRGEKGFEVKGFTLIEVTVASTIFVIGILCVLELFPQGMRGLRSQMQTTAEGVVLFAVRKSVQQTIQEKSNNYFKNHFWEKNKLYRTKNPLLKEGLFKIDALMEEGQPLFDFEYFVTVKEDQGSYLVQLTLKDLSDFDYEKKYQTRV
jgi:prepilin-type N-terminal cleavage/methylation domain-containing protein